MKGSVVVSKMSSGLFCFKFMTTEYMAMVLVESSYYGKHGLIVKKWHLILDLKKEFNRMALVWGKASKPSPRVLG